MTPIYRACCNSLPLNAIFLLLILIVTIVVYTSGKIKYQRTYETHVQQTVRGLLGNYSISIAKNSGQLELGHSNHHTFDDPTETSFEKLPQFRGVLSRTHTHLQQLNIRTSDLFREYITRWATDTHTLEIRPEELFPANQQASEQQAIHIIAPGLIARKNIGTLQDFDNLLAALHHAYRPINTPHKQAQPTPAKEDPLTPLQKQLLAGTQFPETHSDVIPQHKTQQQLHAPERTIAHHTLMEQWLHSLLANPSFHYRPSSDSLQFTIYQNETKHLEKELQNIVNGELKGFWLFGSWRWIEIIAWSIFGIMTNNLLQCGMFLMGWKQENIWTPRGTLYGLMQVVYVPFMSLAVFWLYAYGLSGADPLDGIRSTPAILAYAFIFGLFPTLPYDLLRKMTKSLRRSVDEGPIRNIHKRNKTPTHIPVSTTQNDTKNTAPQFHGLHARIRDIATAPLQHSADKEQHP